MIENAVNSYGDLLERIRAEFGRITGETAPLMVRAPGRVNLIGEHTDYNEGFVLPMAIDRWTTVALAPSSMNEVRLHSLDFEETASFDLSDLAPGHAEGWIRYAQGMAGALAEEGVLLEPWEGVIASNVPIGAGLSSSASMELAIARAFCAVSGWPWDPKRMATLAQRAENRWVGVNCGIMDQLISACALEGQALLVDCRDLSTRAVALPGGYSIVILDTKKRRSLGESAYNERRRQCQEAAALCGEDSLRDVDLSTLLQKRASMDPVVFRRAHHVITENERTLKAAAAMDSGDALLLGQLMDASHASLRDDFEVSCLELDAMVECARVEPGCAGARMTGAGFGGCAVALVGTSFVDSFLEATVANYHQRTGLGPAVYVCQAVAGAEQVREPGG